jgi:peptidylprolyl isomerase
LSGVRAEETEVRFNVPLLPFTFDVQRRVLSRPRISLRGLMLAVGVIAVLLSLGVYLARPTWTQTKSGLRFQDTTRGAGASPKAGQTCTVNYVGWLWVNEAKGKQIDSSLGGGRTPFSFPLGKGQVIKGWEEGVATMLVGGKRTLIIPPGLAYGAAGAGGVIPPNATLIFEIDLLDAR